MLNEQTSPPRTPLRILPVTVAQTSKRLLRTELREMAEGHFRWFSAITKETLETVLTPGFFNGCGTILTPFDRVEVTCEMSGPRPRHARLIVTALELGDGTLITRPECVPGTTPYLAEMAVHDGFKAVHVEVLDAASVE